jgi:hypothetical protein
MLASWGGMGNNIIKQVSLLKQATPFKYIYWKGSQGKQCYRHKDVGKLASWEWYVNKYHKTG